MRVFATRGATHRPDADLRTAVTAEDKAVLDKGDLEGLASAGERGAEAAVATADDDEVVLADIFGAVRVVEVIAIGGEALGGIGWCACVLG